MLNVVSLHVLHYKQVKHNLSKQLPPYEFSTKAQCYKTFLHPQFTNVRNKLECLSLASLSSLTSNLFLRWLEPTQVEHLKKFPSMASPTNIRLGWKGLLEINTLA